MEDYILKILTAIVQLVVAAGLTYLIGYLRTKTGNEKLIQYYDYVKIAVQAIEQIWGAGSGQNKKEEVIKYITDKFGNKISAEDLDKLIEAAVYEMNLVLKQEEL